MPLGITIIGLGPGDSRHWTHAAYTLINEADELHLRVGRHPSMADIPIQIYSFDDIYKQTGDRKQAHQQIAAEVVRLGQRNKGILYAVPGHPILDDPTTPLIQTLAEAQSTPVTIIPGLSLLDATLLALKLNPTGRAQIIPAADIAPLHHPPIAPDQPALVTGLADKPLAVQVKRVLLNAYAAGFVVTLVQAAGTEVERLWSCPLAELDQQPQLDESTALFLPADNANTGFPTFQETVAHLRTPEGCPWDRAQTHQSLRPFLLEETYEVLEALDAGDPTSLVEELGDLLLQIVLHTQIATAAGDFRMGEVVGHIHRKLLRRHPHVFGNTAVNGVEDVITNWEAIKQAERKNSEIENTPPSALDGIPASLPALAQALTISKRAASIGFKWPNVEEVLDRLIEEAQEFIVTADPSHMEAKIGDWFFAAVNLARQFNIDPESALRAANTRFIHRFKKLEILEISRNFEN